MTDKKRVLFVGEASFLNTGFSNIYRSLLPRLLATGKYEIAEHGSYSDANNPGISSFINGRWKFYPALPSSASEMNEFKKFEQCSRPRARGQNTAQFGEWNFEQVVADFKPDIVVAIRDFWMDEFIEYSSFRTWFKWIWMPTVDSPQQDEVWINGYEKLNLCLAYSDFGLHTLKSQSPKIKLFPKPMRPGVDLDIFKPMNKDEVREEFNLAKDIPIIGLVQRNQSRKMILDVIDAFALMKNKYANVNEKVKKAVLLLHTSWPDNVYSFNYPRHIKRLQGSPWMKNYRSGIMYDVLQTLHCNECGSSSVCFAMNLDNQPIQHTQLNGQKVAGIFMPCPHCGKQSATCPNTGIGYTRENLAKVYNLMNVMVQCSIAEGDGMPATECKACGVPVIVTDHSALSEKGRFPEEFIHLKDQNINESDYTVNKGGITHKVAGYRHEPETGCLRAVTDINDLAENMFKLLEDDELRNKMSKEARQCAEENYDWDKISKQWEYVLDNVKALDRSKTWNTPIEPVVNVQSKQPPANLTDDQFVDWLYLEILAYPTVDFTGKLTWMENFRRGMTRDQMLQQFVAIGNQQSDGSRKRDLIRSTLENTSIVSNNRKQELI